MYLAFQFLQDCLDQSPPSPIVLTHQQVQEIMTFYNSHQYVFPLKIYSGYSILMGFEEGACLIFAPNRREAKKLAFKQLKGWYDDMEWTDVGVARLQRKDFLYVQADQEKLKLGVSHVISSPITCLDCNDWNTELNTERYCEGCEAKRRLIS